MSTPGAQPADEPEDEVAALIDLLHRTSARIEELTGGEIDAVTDTEGRPFLLRHAQEHLRHIDAARQAAILDALPAHVAVLDPSGRIVSVNNAWKAFGRTNTLVSPNSCVGDNYLAVCDAATGDQTLGADRIAFGILGVLSGSEASFSFEYPCHSPTEKRWFLMTATPLSKNFRAGAVIMHVNTTAEKQAAQELLAGEARFRQMAENIRDVFFLRDAASGRVLYVSPAYEEIWGRTCASLYADAESWAEAIHPDDRKASDLASLGAFSGEFGLDYRIIRPDGAVRWIESRGFPVLENGQIARVAGVAKDITERKIADEKIVHLSRVYAMLSGINTLIVRVRDRDELFREACRIAVEAGGFRMSLIAVVDPKTSTLTPTASAGKDEGLIAEVAELLSHPEAAPRTMVARAIRDKAPVVSNDSVNDPRLLLGRRYLESEVRSIAILPLLIADEAVGVLALYSGEVEFFHEAEMKLLGDLANDIAFCMGALRSRAHKEKADEALRASLSEKEALLKEVHHRVKNNMQVITSLLRLEANRIDHPTTRSVLRDMQNRILAMAALHEALYRSNNFAQVDLCSYLKQLTGQLARSSVASPGQVRFVLDLFPVGLELDQAVPCGLIVNELVSNAMKHGFPAGRPGEIRVGMEWAQGGLLRLRVTDDGVGLSPDFETRRGKSLGLLLVTDLARQLGGSFRIGPGPAAVFEVSFAPAAQADGPPVAPGHGVPGTEAAWHVTS